MGKILPEGNLLGRSGSVLRWPSRSWLCSGEPRGDFSDKSKSDELWTADGTGNSPWRCWYTVAFFSLSLLCQTKWFKSYFMTLESVNRGCQIYTNLQVNLCDRAWKTTTRQRLYQDWNSELTEVSRSNHWPSSLLCIFHHQAVTFVFRGPQAALNRIQGTEDFCSTEESQTAIKPTYTAQHHLLTSPSASGCSENELQQCCTSVTLSQPQRHGTHGERLYSLAAAPG